MKYEEQLKEAYRVIEELVYYSQIHTVRGVQPVEMRTHDEAWRAGQKLLHDNNTVVNGKYKLKQSQ
jgi:hypothetical protein